MDGTEIPLAGNTATSGNYANSGECWDYFASWSVGNEGPVTVSDYGTGYPKGCWRQGNYRYFNTGAGGAQPASIPICSAGALHPTGPVASDKKIRTPPSQLASLASPSTLSPIRMAPPPPMCSSIQLVLHPTPTQFSVLGTVHLATSSWRHSEIMTLSSQPHRQRVSQTKTEARIGTITLRNPWDSLRTLMSALARPTPPRGRPRPA